MNIEVAAFSDKLDIVRKREEEKRTPRVLAWPIGKMDCHSLKYRELLEIQQFGLNIRSEIFISHPSGKIK